MRAIGAAERALALLCARATTRTAFGEPLIQLGGNAAIVADLRTAVAQKAADAAIQIHGGAGVSGDFPLAGLYVHARLLRLADGPDEVHRGVIAKLELKAQLAAASPPP